MTAPQIAGGVASFGESVLATPEELAARKAKAAADAQASLSPAEALTAAHDHVSDDDLAEKIAAHPDRDIFLALWRRITG